jgi:hypothetical protein
LSNEPSTSLTLAENLSRSALRKGAAINWPRAVDERVDELVALATEAGQRTNRSELAAALVFATAADGDSIGDLLVAYRVATNRDALVREIPTGANVVSLERHGPGPRVRTSGSS